MKFSIKLKRLAEKNDVAFFEHTEYHLQLRALHIVNVYESKSTFYIQGMKSKEKFDPDDLDFLIKLAKGDTDFTYNNVPAKRKDFKKSKRLILWQKNPTCYWCRELIHDYKTATTEHIIPLVKGGSNRDDNLALSHHECNQERGESIGIKKHDDQKI